MFDKWREFKRTMIVDIPFHVFKVGGFVFKFLVPSLTPNAKERDTLTNCVFNIFDNLMCELAWHFGLLSVVSATDLIDQYYDT